MRTEKEILERIKELEEDVITPKDFNIRSRIEKIELLRWVLSGSTKKEEKPKKEVEQDGRTDDNKQVSKRQP